MGGGVEPHLPARPSQLFEPRGPKQPPGLSEKGGQHAGPSEAPKPGLGTRTPEFPPSSPALNLHCFPHTPGLQPIWLSCPLIPRHTHSRARGPEAVGQGSTVLAGGKAGVRVERLHFWSFSGDNEAWFPKEGAASHGLRASCLLPRESRLGTAHKPNRAVSVSILRGMEGPRTQV